MQDAWVQSLCLEDLLEQEMATHSSILAQRIPSTEEPSGLQSMGSRRVGHNRATEHAQLAQMKARSPLAVSGSTRREAPGRPWREVSSQSPDNRRENAASLPGPP